jgi:hypothetical protein
MAVARLVDGVVVMRRIGCDPDAGRRRGGIAFRRRGRLWLLRSWRWFLSCGGHRSLLKSKKAIIRIG